MLADLDDRLDQAVQGSLRQPGGVAGPLLLGDDVEEEVFLIAIAEVGGLAPLHRDDVGRARLDGHEPRLMLLLAAGTGNRHHGQQATPGFSHGT